MAEPIIVSTDPDQVAATYKALRDHGLRQTMQRPGVIADELEPDAATCQVVKASDERRYTLGVAYPAMKADVNRAADGRRDFMRAEEVEKTAWRWMTDSRQVGLLHADGTEGHGQVVESYIWRGDPWVIKAADGAETTVMPGDWLVGTVWDEPTWTAIKSGLLGGYSPQGRCRVNTPTAEQLAQLRS